MAQNVINAVLKIAPQVDNAQQAVNQIKQAFQGLKLNDSLSKSFQSDFKKFDDLADKYRQFISAAENSKLDSSQFSKVVSTGREFQGVLDRIIDRWSNLTGTDLKLTIADVQSVKDAQKAVDELQTKMKQVAPAATELENSLKVLQASPNTKNFIDFSQANLQAKDLETSLKDIQTSFQNYDFTTAGQQITNFIQSLDSGLQHIKNQIDTTKTSIKDLADKKKNLSILSEEKTTDYQAKIDTVKADKVVETYTAAGAAVDQLQAKISAASTKFSNIVPKEAQQAVNDFIASLSKPLSFQNLKSFNDEVKKVRTVLKDSGASKSAKISFANTFNPQFFDKYIQSANNAVTALANVRNAIKDLNSITKDSTLNVGNLDSISQLVKNGDLQGASTKIQAVIAGINNSITQLQNKINANPGNIAQAQAYQQQITDLTNSLKELENAQSGIDALKTKMSGFSDTINNLKANGLENAATELERLKNSLTNEQATALNKILQDMNALGAAGEDASKGLNKEKTTLEQTIESAISADRQFSNLFTRLARFTTLTGIFDIIKRSINSAYEAVKELDAAMNSIAVVTDMTTGDLWAQIDSYTDMANATGSTIQGAYEVAQLYYQQGLSTNDVLTATTETLKLARVAGIEYADATDYMTAAVKGFGLSYQDLSHIMDVYSNLAAKTAADTEEISIAMSKVASIANSTGMSLENTAGFLTQIIATTRL